MTSRYKVELSKRVIDEFEALARIAVAEGRRIEFQDAAQKIMSGLRLVPHDLGESRSLYSQLRIQGRIYFFGSLTVEFGVHLDRPIVFVRKFKWRQRR